MDDRVVYWNSIAPIVREIPGEEIADAIEDFLRLKSYFPAESARARWTAPAKKQLTFGDLRSGEWFRVKFGDGELGGVRFLKIGEEHDTANTVFNLAYRFKQQLPHDIEVIRLTATFTDATDQEAHDGKV